ncbi:Hypotetical protein [Gulosibacter molinativorax]|nr:Hypotetical protein [Gulosibacter molinativorax]
MERIRRPVVVIIGVFLVCAALRVFEYAVLRTDQSPIAEAIVHKLGAL